MSRPLFLLAALALFAGCAEPEPAGWRPRHVVMVSVDTLRADHLGAYGYPRETSPFFDRLAAEGVLFETALASTSTTAPSHASILTGLHPIQHGLRRNGQKLPEEATLLTERLAAAGWDTAGFVSTNAHFSVSRLDAGFAHFDEPARGRGKAARSADGTVDAAARWLQKRSSKAPLFLWIHLFDPHSPYETRGGLYASGERRDALVRFKREQHHVPPDFLGGHGPRLAALIGAYDGEILRVDRALAHLHQVFVDTLGPEDTLWIVTADHGEGLGNHGWLLHGKKIYNEQLRVPLLFHAPGTFAPRRVPGVAKHVDLVPTLLELAGLEPATGPLPGRSLVPTLRDGAPLPDRDAFAERRTFGERRRRPPPKPLPPEPTLAEVLQNSIQDNFEPGERYAIQDGRHKLIWHSQRGRELYDLSIDPYETRDLAGEEPELADALEARLKERLRTLQASSLRAGAEAVDPDTRRALESLGYIDP